MAKDDWQKSAERENSRRTAKAPLLAHAGLVPLVSPEQRQQAMEERRRRFEARTAEQDARAVALTAERRALVLARAPQDVERVDRHVAAHPPGYGPMVLQEMLDRLDQGLPPLREDQAPSAAKIAEWRERGSIVAAALRDVSPEERCLLEQLAQMTSRGRRGVFAQLSKLRAERITAALLAAGYEVEAPAPNAEVDDIVIGVRLTLPGQVVELRVSKEGARALLVPGPCACGADPVPVTHGMATEGPGGLLGQAVCGACGRGMGRFEAWWLGPQGNAARPVGRSGEPGP